MQLRKKNLYALTRNVEGKKIIIFGSDMRARQLWGKLCLLDIKVEYFVDDIIEECCMCGCKVRNYYELLYEDSDKILVVVIDRKDLRKLFDSGICTELNKSNYFPLFGYVMQGPCQLDPTIGYNIPGDTEFPGFVVFGDRKAECTIVTLGGSATDATWEGFKSWSQILADKLAKENRIVRVLCGGVVGQKSTQELLKLIRDVIPLRPNMVIVYDGFNDVNRDYCDKPFPFLHTYQKQLMSAICQTKREGLFVNAKGYTLGIDSKEEAYTTWKNSTRMMHALCEEFGIKFISVLQPSLYNQIGKFGKKEWEIWLHDPMSDEYRQCFERFFYGRDNDTWQPEFIKDLRNIFHGLDGIFYDHCHIGEKGNEIIADKMLEYVKECLFN